MQNCDVGLQSSNNKALVLEMVQRRGVGVIVRLYILFISWSTSPLRNFDEEHFAFHRARELC